MKHVSTLHEVIGMKDTAEASGRQVAACSRPKQVMKPMVFYVHFWSSEFVVALLDVY